MFRRLIIFTLFLPFFVHLHAQKSFVQELDATDLPDTIKINRLNDHAWELLRKFPDSTDLIARDAILRSVQADSFTKGLINAHVILGALNKDRGFFGSSVEHYMQALPLAEKAGDFLRVSGCLNNLGSVYQAQGNYSKALATFQQSLEIEKANNADKAQISIRLYNIGESFLKLDSLDEAYAYYYQSLLLESELNSQEGIFYARLGIGQVDTRKQNFGKAEEELMKALQIGQALENGFGVCETEIALGNLELQKRKPSSALKWLEPALQKTQAQGYRSLEIEATTLIAEAFEEAGNYDQAIQFHKRAFELKELLNSSEVNSRIAEFQMKYELEKKEQVLALALKENELNESEVKYQTKLKNYLLFTVILAALLILFNLRRNKRQRRPK